MMNGGRYDFADLAKRCRYAANVRGELSDSTQREMFAECATVFENMGPAIEAMPEVVRVNCAHAVRETALNIAEALDQLGREYAIGKRLGTAQGALRIFAAWLRDSQKPKEAGAEKKALILQ